MNYRAMTRITAVFFVSNGDTLDLPYPCPCMKVVIVSRLSELLSKLSRTRQMSQIQIVDRSEELGMPLSKANVSKYLSGKHPEKPSTSTLDKFAQVLDVPLDDLVAAATFTGREPFDLDPSSDRLTASQRAVVNEVIRQFADANEKAGDGDAEATPNKRAGVSPATGEDDGLGAFGGRARGDLDHENLNDGNGDNVYSLVPPPPASDTAAYRAPNRGKKQKDKQDEDAEESQDPEGGDEE